MQKEQAVRDQMQVDMVICRTHLAAFFWQLNHVFEALRHAIRRGQKEHPGHKYFWHWEEHLNEIEETDWRTEIRSYRNKAHEIPAIIGCLWEGPKKKFVRHFCHQSRAISRMNRLT